MDLWKRITDSRVLSALKRVDRERFVPENVRQFASENRPLPIGFHQTISQPFIVAFMTQALSLTGGERVLEIGTGSGFQTAVLAELGVSVFSVERIPELHARASHALTLCGYQNMHLLCGDGYQGWASEAPFDAILVTAAPSSLPHALVEQLAEGGRLVIPLADRQARSAGEILMRFTKRGGVAESEELLPVRFVPMVHGDARANESCETEGSEREQDEDKGAEDREEE